MKTMHDAASIEAVVLNKSLEAAIHELREENAEIRASYRRGDICLDDARNMLFRPVVASRAAHAAGLAWAPRGTTQMKCYSLLTCVSQAAYNAMLADHTAWLAGANSDSTDGAPWLFSRGNKRNIKPRDFLSYYHEEAARPEEEAVFFSLLEATFYPVEFFSPPPDGMLVPVDEINLETGAFGNRWWAEALYCTMDVSCLLSDGDPVGRHFDLGLEEGGIAHIVVKDMEFDLKYPEYVEPDPDRVFWRAAGWVEGYTCDFEREIEFVSDDARVGMGLIMSQVPGDIEAADRSAYLTCPLWAPFRDWEVEYKRKWRAAADQAIEDFLVDGRR